MEIQDRSQAGRITKEFKVVTRNVSHWAVKDLWRGFTREQKAMSMYQNENSREEMQEGPDDLSYEECSPEEVQDVLMTLENLVEGFPESSKPKQYRILCAALEIVREQGADALAKKRFYEQIYERVREKYPDWDIKREHIRIYWRNLCRSLQRAGKPWLDISSFNEDGLPRFVDELQQGDNELTRFLRARFSGKTCQLLDAHTQGSDPSSELVRSLLLDLNRQLYTHLFYEEDCFAAVPLSDSLRRRCRRVSDFNPIQIALLNKDLLRAAYTEIFSD